MLLRAENISKQFFRRTRNANVFCAVRDVTLTLEPGKLIVLMGRSGSGKTTLLNILAGLLRPTSGSVFLEEKELYALSDDELSRIRNTAISVIPQGRSTIDHLSVYENILLPGRMFRRTYDRQIAEGWMRELGIEELRDVRTAELSGGELRRVAIARALSQGTDVLLADEPTGDLDDANTRKVLSILRQIAQEEQKAVLIVSHDDMAADYADALYRMDNGSILA